LPYIPVSDIHGVNSYPDALVGLYEAIILLLILLGASITNIYLNPQAFFNIKALKHPFEDPLPAPEHAFIIVLSIQVQLGGLVSRNSLLDIGVDTANAKKGKTKDPGPKGPRLLSAPERGMSRSNQRD